MKLLCADYNWKCSERKKDFILRNIVIIGNVLRGRIFHFISRNIVVEHVDQGHVENVERVKCCKVVGSSYSNVNEHALLPLGNWDICPSR